MEGILVCSKPFLFTENGGCKLGSVIRFAHSCRGKTTTGESRHEGDRDVRGRFASNHRGTKTPRQVGRTHRSELGVVKRWVPLARSYKGASPQRAGIIEREGR